MSWNCRRWARGGGWRRLAALAALLALAACARLPVRRASSLAFPHVHPARAAHLLADFSAHPHAAAAWRLEDERGNYTDWSYRVSFECGARCTGEAAVRAAAGGATEHGHALRHSVRLQLVACSRPPLLPWPRVCDETEVEWAVLAAGGGCVLEESARAWCGALRVLSGACTRDLRDQRAAHLQHLRAALAQQQYAPRHTLRS